MYLVERLMWSHRTESRESRDQWDEVQRKEFGPGRVYFDPDAKTWGVRDSLDLSPNDAGSIYDINNTFVDVRAAFQEEKRGLLTFGLIAFGSVLAYMLWGAVLEPFYYMAFKGTTFWGAKHGPKTGSYLLFLFCCSLGSSIWFFDMRCHGSV